jgi:Na+/H+ antiporter NhaC
MDIITLLGLISSVTGIISFILYFVDKQQKMSKKTGTQQSQGLSFSDWRIWLVFTLIAVAILSFKISVQQITGIEGNNNDNNEINISPK